MWSRMLDPDVEHYLLDLEGEVLVDEIHRHWVTRIVPIPVVFGGAVVLGTAPALLDVAWLPVSAGLGLIGYGLIRLIREQGARPALIVGMPVGFVSAAESKDLLMTANDVPWVAICGRKGGSTLVVAAIHALLGLAEAEQKRAA